MTHNGIELEEGDVRVAIDMVVEAAGTGEADWKVLSEAGKIIATLLRRNAELEDQVQWLERNIPV